MLFSVGHLENELIVWGLHYLGAASAGVSAIS